MVRLLPLCHLLYLDKIMLILHAEDHALPGQMVLVMRNGVILVFAILAIQFFS